MAFRKPLPRRRKECPVALAIAAIEGRPNPLDDAEMAKVNPDRISLDLPEKDGRLAGKVRSGTRRSRTGMGACIVCGESPCEDCA
jgi:hypothetical protein